MRLASETTAELDQSSLMPLGFRDSPEGSVPPILPGGSQSQSVFVKLKTRIMGTEQEALHYPVQSYHPQGMSKLQKITHFMAVFDILFFFATIIASVSIENAVSELRPIQLDVNENGSVSFSYSNKDELRAVWDYLYIQHYESDTLYNAVYMVLVVLVVTYFIIEVWLLCVLIRGSTERSLAHCKKWFWWRMSLILMTLMVAATDLYKMQYTFTLLLFVPLCLYRILLVVVVLHLIAEYTGERGPNNKDVVSMPWNTLHA